MAMLNQEAQMIEDGTIMVFAAELSIKIFIEAVYGVSPANRFPESFLEFLKDNIVGNIMLGTVFLNESLKCYPFPEW